MSVFIDGKEVSANNDMPDINQAVMKAMEKAGDVLMSKLSKIIDNSPRSHIDSVSGIETHDEETMRALAKIASRGTHVESSNFATLGREEAVNSDTNIDNVIDSLGDIE